MPRLAANLSMLFQEHDLLDRFDAAARVGFRGVEVLFPYDRPAGEIARAVRDSGVEMVLINTPPGDWAAGERGLAGLPGREAAFREAFARAVETARQLDAGRIHVMSGVAAEDASVADCRNVLVGNLTWAAAEAERVGLQLTVEPLNQDDVPGYLLKTQRDALDILDRIGHPAVGLQFDCYHCQMVEGRLTKWIDAAIERIRHVQIAGVPDRREPDSGEVHYPFLLDRLDRLGYRGWVSAEYRPAGRTLDGLGWAVRYGIRTQGN